MGHFKKRTKWKLWLSVHSLLINTKLWNVNSQMQVLFWLWRSSAAFSIRPLSGFRLFIFDLRFRRFIGRRWFDFRRLFVSLFAAWFRLLRLCSFRRLLIRCRRFRIRHFAAFFVMFDVCNLREVWTTLATLERLFARMNANVNEKGMLVALRLAANGAAFVMWELNSAICSSLVLHLGQSIR